MFHLSASSYKNPVSVPSLAVLVLAKLTVFPDKLDRDQSQGSNILQMVLSGFYMPHFSLLCCALQQSLPKVPGDKSRSKKSKEPKPWVKKLKYHQYVPPDQKQELNEVPMDSAYARLLQQQQQFLQLQILNQQQQQYNYKAVLSTTVKYGNTNTPLAKPEMGFSSPAVYLYV